LAAWKIMRRVGKFETWTSPALRARPPPRRALFPFLFSFLHRRPFQVVYLMAVAVTRSIELRLIGRDESYPAFSKNFKSSRHYEGMSTRRLSIFVPRTLSVDMYLLCEFQSHFWGTSSTCWRLCEMGSLLGCVNIIKYKRACVLVRN